MKKLSTLTIILPCFNEEEVIKKSYFILKQLIDKWINKLISDYEIIMVNDGSSDNTINEMISLYKIDKRIVIIDLRKNYGFQGALTAGLHHASNDMVVTIDADLQDDPEKIEDMIKKYYDGFELVLGVRKSRKTDSFLKRYLAQSYYKIAKSFGVKSVYNHADFRLLSKALVDDLKDLNEKNRYLRSLIFELENKFATVEYERRKRLAGTPKFTIFSSFSLGINGITSFSSIPIHYIFYLGILMFFLSILGFLYIFISKYILGTTITGWTSLAFLIILFGGIQNLAIGIIGEYISKIYFETKNRPIYRVRKLYKKQ